MNKEVLMSTKEIEKNELGMFGLSFIIKLINYILDLNMLLKKQQNLMEREVWTCKFCNAQEKDVTKFATHISQHYSMQVRKTCEICKSAFMTHKGLKKHIKIVHANKSVISIDNQSENTHLTKKRGDTKDAMLGGPLLNDMLTDSMDNTNLLLQQTDISRFDMHNDILLDNDNLNLAVENFIQDDDNFNFNIDEDKVEHICDICLKPFAKLKRLVQHLQKHTGKYTCSECLVIFSRNENLQAHKCNIHKKQLVKCVLCDKQFSLKKYLSRHIQAVHERKRSCPKCSKTYHSDKEIKEHNCSGISEIEKEKYPCLLCNKTFYRESYIKKHMKLHAPIKQAGAAKDELYICEICAKTFRTGRNLARHKKTHFQTSFACDKCDKSFTRVDTLNHHVTVEHCSFSHPCTICEKVFKSKKYLQIHMTTHTKRKNVQCSACNRKFFQKSALENHFKLKHAVQCNKCGVDNCNHLKTLIECYECPICHKLLKLRSSTLRHIKNNHPHSNIDSDKIERVRRIWRSTTTASDRSNNVDDENHVEVEVDDERSRDKAGSNIDGGNESFKAVNVEFCEENEKITGKNETNVLDFNNLSFELDSSLSMNNQEICLSMPELTEMDQDVTLSDNAYVLENGTIVEPLDSENIVVYIFDKK
ncbi:zinc finger protein [Oryctes borbonicus]|uniref:Zinc finger protein n=1 Tax=Oryctes borbonicus TaxID=1629725 RepID=A0A0T6ATZ7_9SCAR|nr:zinc finger protein [Oryctes borbonicus]